MDDSNLILIEKDGIQRNIEENQYNSYKDSGWSKVCKESTKEDMEKRTSK